MLVPSILAIAISISGTQALKLLHFPPIPSVTTTVWLTMDLSLAHLGASLMTLTYLNGLEFTDNVESNITNFNFLSQKNFYHSCINYIFECLRKKNCHHCWHPLSLSSSGWWWDYQCTASSTFPPHSSPCHIHLNYPSWNGTIHYIFLDFFKIQTSFEIVDEANRVRNMGVQFCHGSDGFQWECAWCVYF